MNDRRTISNLYYLFSEKYLEKLSNSPDVSNVKCGIHIGGISGNIKNCRFSIINACNSNQEKVFSCY